LTVSETGPEPGALTLDEVARRLGVHYMTAYRYLRIGRLAAEQRDGRWLVPTEEVERLSRTTARKAKRAGTGARTLADQSDRVLRRLIAGDGPGSWAVVEAALAISTPTDVYLHVLAPAMRRLGEQWVAGEVTIGQEHTATSVAIRILGRLSPSFSRPGRRRPGTVVIAGVAGDPHVMPAAMVVDVLRGEGFTVVDLGADVPPRALIEAIEPHGDLVAVGLSLSVERHASSVVDTIGALREARPDVAVLAGGPAVADRSAAQRLGTEHWAPDAVSVAELVKDLSRVARS
jgi:excisionase family DNA binding protein